MKSTYRDGDTVGTLYNKSQQKMEGITVGEVNRQMLGGLLDDINETIQSNPYNLEPFYISVVEEKDLLMTNAIKRRIFTTKYRPFPEDNTMVYYTNPREERTFYCWDLPHHSEIPNIVSYEHLYDPDYILKIKQFLRGELDSFGFQKVSLNNSLVEGHDEKAIRRYRQSYIHFCRSRGMDDRDIENEKRLGFFWIPNPHFKYKLLDDKIKISLIGV